MIRFFSFFKFDFIFRVFVTFSYFVHTSYFLKNLWLSRVTVITEETVAGCNVGGGLVDISGHELAGTSKKRKSLGITNNGLAHFI